MKKFWVAVCAAGLAACIPVSGPPAPDPADVHGRIVEIIPAAGGQGSVLLAEHGATTPQWALRIDANTRLERETANRIEPLTRADLRRGQQVRVTVRGPVAESFPMQAYAARIRVMPD